MANMSYCRFHNTLLDLEDCLDAIYDSGLTLEDFVNPDREPKGDWDESIISHDESLNAKRLLATMMDFVDSNRDEIEDLVG